MNCLMPSHVNCHDVEVVIGIFDPLAAEVPGSTFVSLYFSLPLAAPLRRLRRRCFVPLAAAFDPLTAAAGVDPLAAACGGVDPLIL